MSDSKHFLFVFLIFSASLSETLTQWSENVSTTCAGDQSVQISQSVNRPTSLVSVDLTPTQAKSSGLLCRWRVSAPLQNESTELVFFGASDGTACHEGVYTVYEENPASGEHSLLPYRCYGTNNSQYEGVTGQVAFPLVVELKAHSPLPQFFNLMLLATMWWTDKNCPRYERKVVPAGNANIVSSLRWYMFSRALPRNLSCRWEFRAPDQGLVSVKLLRTSSFDKVCENNASFKLSDVENSASPTTINFCQKEVDNPYTYVSSTGSVFVDFESFRWYGDGKHFELRHSAQPSCPGSDPLELTAEPPSERLLKGSSYSPQGAGQVQTCRWRLQTFRSMVVRLHGLQAPDFQRSCNASQDYLLVDGRKVDLCEGGDTFPMWTAGSESDVELRTLTTEHRRNLLLRYTAARKTACQGHPERVIVSSSLTFDYKRLPAFSTNDSNNGLVCQWMFTADKFATGHVVQVSIDKAVSGKGADGVSYDPKTCSYARFKAYNGQQALPDYEISPRCGDRLGTPIISYTGNAKDMLFVYTRPSAEDEKGFLFRMKQVKAGTSGALRSGENTLVLLFFFSVAFLGILS